MKVNSPGSSNPVNQFIAWQASQTGINSVVLQAPVESGSGSARLHNRDL